MPYDISLIIPLSGHQPRIDICLDSILNQSFNGTYEIIIIENNALKETHQKVWRWANEYNDKIKLIIDNNITSPGGARNKGIKNASGDYLVFLDSDDFVSKDYLSSLFAGIKAQKADILCQNYYYYQPKKHQKHRFITSLFMQNKTLNSLQAIKMLLNDFTLRGFSPAKIYRKEIIKDLLFFESRKICEDVIFNYLAFSKAKKIVLDKKRNYFYTLSNNSETSPINVPNLIQSNINMIAVIAFLEKYYFKRRPLIYKLFPYTAKKVLIYFYLCQLDKTKYNKKLIKKEIKKQLKLIKNDYIYLDTPYEDFIKELNFDESNLNNSRPSEIIYDITTLKL